MTETHQNTGGAHHPAGHEHTDDHGHGHEHPHADSHSHPHQAPHTPAEPASYGPSREGTVLVDIGGDVGALIIDTPPALAGLEIEISPAGSARRTHVAVRERHGEGPVRHAAVFPGLAAGAYTVWDPQGQARRTAVITGASVTRITW